MSESIRQSTLFGAEDYKKVFKSFQFIDYTAYDFDTLKQALITYIQTYYPEDFNDYIESSEFIAIIELLAYFGTSLAFRTELNSRENFIDTATRKESIIRLAQMVNYVPRRNVPASGLFKISAVQTNQPLVDANGLNINDVSIFWNDPNNPDWFDQFVQICNAAFSTLNPFGRPTKSGTIGSIPTDLYQLDNVLNLNVTYPTSVSISGQQYPIDICNPDFVTNQTIFEKDPNPAEPFSFIYRNDSLGMSSPNTGFFLLFKQGSLLNIDSNFEFPVPNRTFPIDIQNINQDDVYVQETDQDGNVITIWKKVPALAGENVIYNSIQFSERNIFDVISGANDTITVRFADGNFGNVPTGLFRTWVRVSANQDLVIRPDDAQGLQINIPYIGSDNQEYVLRIAFNLEQTIGNAAPSETSEQIKLRAPEVFSTQSRMVNGSDYNVLPLIYGNQIAKIQAISRTYSGQSRYIEPTDPTGFHKDLTIFGEDGALYRENQNVLVEVTETQSNSGTIQSVLINTIQQVLRDKQVSTFYYDEYIPQFQAQIRVNPPNTGRSLLDLVPTATDPGSTAMYWKTSPSTFKNDTGYFYSTDPNSAITLQNLFNENNVSGGTYHSFGFIKSGSVIQFATPTSNPTTVDVTTLHNSNVNAVIQNGLPTTVSQINPYSSVGPVELSTEEQVGNQAVKIYPTFRNTLTTSEIQSVVNAINIGLSFYMFYDLITDTWGVSTASTPGLSDQSTQPFAYPVPSILPAYTSNTGATIVGTLVTVASTVGLLTNMSIQVNNASGIHGLFSNTAKVLNVLSPTTFTVSELPILPFDGLTQLVAGQEQILSNWAEVPAAGIVYIAIGGTQPNRTFNITARGRVYVFESYRDVRFYWEPGKVVVDNTTGLALEDNIEIMPLINTNRTVDNNNSVIPVDPTTAYLRDPITFSLSGVFTQVDGYVDTSKVEVILTDTNADGIADNPDGFDRLVSYNDRVVFEYYDNAVTGFQSARPWISKWNTTLQSSTTLYVYFPTETLSSTSLYSPPFISPTFVANPLLPPATAVFMDTVDLLFIYNIDQLNSIATQVTTFLNTQVALLGTPYKSSIVNSYFSNKSYLLASISPPGFGKYYSLSTVQTSNPFFPNGVSTPTIDQTRYDRNGKSFTQNSNASQNFPLYFKWSHFSPTDQRVDPASTNIIDMITITNSYYNDMLVWKNSNGTLSSLPSAPTTEELRVQFQDLDQYKMVSDSMIWNSGTFKLLFGSQAAKELQATFKVVKAPSSSISDNEVKTLVIQAIDTYFDIRNWDFGEKFYWSELSAYIHQALSRTISSVVIVPSSADSQFGNLFEIIASPTELFMSTATVNNVQIVSNLTNQNLRI